MAWSEAEIGQPRETAVGREKVPASAREGEADRVLSVVRYGKSIYLEVAEFECGTRVEQFPFWFRTEFWLQRPGGQNVGVYRWLEAFAECGEAGGVVSVFVSEKNRVDFLGFNASRFEHFAGTPATEADVDKDFAVFGDQQAAVARAAATEN